MYCPKCGTQNPDNAQSCNSCGAVLTPPSPAGVLGTPPQGVPDGAYGEPIVPKTSGLAITALV
ncbi:MAG: zinc-ribbon domain-containing protein, partial [Sedimentisphaerales bacterium]|nr:zinc-ribbon domain-containing protein [Sedimentisphaerales bacterium]